MARNIEIDDDIWEIVCRNVCAPRETESAVLRRLLNLPDANALASLPTEPGSQASPTADLGGEELRRPVASQSELMRFLADPSFRYRRTATDKYLRVLGFVYKQDPTGFAKLLEISGRNRKHFGRSREEIENSGISTHPRQIPESEYWAMTNADTRQKSDMLRNALRVLGYSDGDVRAAHDAIF